MVMLAPHPRFHNLKAAVGFRASDLETESLTVRLGTLGLDA
jgi:hypothetical protein